MVLINQLLTCAGSRQRRCLIKHLIVLIELATPPGGVAILPSDLVSNPYHGFLLSFLFQNQCYRGVAPTFGSHLLVISQGST